MIGIKPVDVKEQIQCGKFVQVVSVVQDQVEGLGVDLQDSEELVEDDLYRGRISAVHLQHDLAVEVRG